MQGQGSQQCTGRYVPQLPPRVRLMRPALAGLLLLFTMLAGSAGEARADKLVSNLTTLLEHQYPLEYFGVDFPEDEFNEGGVAAAQKFTTGSAAGGYTITSVDTCLIFIGEYAKPQVSIYTVGTDGNPGTILHMLPNPSPLVHAGWGPEFTSCEEGKNTFTATAANATLDADTDYFVVFENVGIGRLAPSDFDFSYYGIAWVLNGAEEDGGASGWSLADLKHKRKHSNANWKSDDPTFIRPLRIQINGVVGTDTTAPTLSTATVDGTSLVLTYNEALDTSSEPATSAYSVSVNSGAGAAPSSVDVSGMTVTLTLGTAVTAGQTVTVTYTVPPSNPVQDAAGNDVAALTNESVTNNTNAPPVFASSTATRSIPETFAARTVQTVATIGAPVTATDADPTDTLTYTLEGTDAGKFRIMSGPSGGQLTTKAGQAYDYETKTSYTVTLKADDGKDGTDTIAVTITVINDPTEIPLVPAVSAVSATGGSTRSLDVTWTAPSNTGRPAITGYDLQYRKGTSDPWTNGPQNVPGPSRSISNLDANSAYQVQVRATNAAGDSAWSSPPGSGRTANNAPVFTNSSATRSIAETVGDTTVQTAGDVGAPVTAMDADMETLEHSLEGTDAGKFTIVPGTGQLRTKRGEFYDHEVKASYAVTVRASDGTGSDTIAVTITVTDATEKPLTPVAPTVTTTRESTTSLDVTWTAPNNVGRPAITRYDLQYKKSTEVNWTAGPQNQTGTSASISSLDGNSEYQVQMRATNADGDSAWSEPGSGSTANNAPVFADSTGTRSIPETEGEATVSTPADIGEPFMATDTDNDTITYTLEGVDEDKFSIVSGASGGQLTTKAGQSYDYEALPELNKSYAVTVKATDTTGGSGVIAVTITVTNNETETPLAPTVPAVSTTPGVRMTLEVMWTAPVNTGRPAITSYDLQYRKGNSGNFTDGPQKVTGTSTSITGLDGNATYEVQVRASNTDGDGAWSSPGSGLTVNNPPTLTPAAARRSFPETVGEATVQAKSDIGEPVTATDPDNDRLTYSLEGVDADKFTIVEDTGQIQTKGGEAYNHEATKSYAVTVKADDGKDDGTDSTEVTLNVANVAEFDSASVTEAGTHVNVVFLEELSTTLPEPSAITVTVDAAEAEFRDESTCKPFCPISLGSGDDKRIQIALVNLIREGQTVTVSYEDPTANNDPMAIQDKAGNDAASFTDQPVTNNSTVQPRSPDTPTNLIATADGSTRIDLSWTAPADNGGRSITGYRIEVSTDEGTTGLNVIWNDVVADTGDSNTTYTEIGLSPGTTLYYRVLAINSEGTSGVSNVADETTPTGDGTPSTPRNLKPTAIGKTQIDLSWDPPGDEGNSPVTGYNIQVSEGGGNTWTDLEANTGNTATTYEHTGLNPGTTYAYRVFAINSSVDNPEPAGDHVNAMTFPLDAPDVPENLRAEPGDRQVTLIWEPPAELDPQATLVTYYWKVHYGDTEGDWNPAMVAPDCNPCRTTVPGVTNGVTYTFFVRAVAHFLDTEGSRKGQGRNGVPAQIEVVPRAPVTTGGRGGGGGPSEEPTGILEEPTGILENPGSNSFQSGIGVLSGWVCDADTVEIELNGVVHEAAYGTERLDTEPVCGDSDNGFGLLFNWNLLGDGEHEVVAFVDGIELDRATVTVTTLGAEFLRDVAGSCPVEDFPLAEETVPLVWQQNNQNFVLAEGSRPSGENRSGIAGVGFLENPGPNSFQSGVGVLSGWACEAEAVEIEITTESGDVGRQVAAYGTERLDTQDACGDSDNGFGLLFNWNLLGDGVHEVVAFVDGEELGRATVRVTTLGAEFLRGVAGECVVENFPTTGETVTLEWQQNSQNFVIADIE